MISDTWLWTIQVNKSRQ